MTQKTITVTASTEDQRTLGAISRLFAELASGALLDKARTGAAATVAEFKQEFQPAQPVEVELPSTDEAPTVDTAKVFSGDFAQEQVAATTGHNFFTPTPIGRETTTAPPAPPVPEAPAAQVPTPPTAPTYNVHAVEVDKAGLPWDDRINTSNRAKTEKGIWKMRKGLPAGVYDAVVAELKGVMALGATPAAPAPVPPTNPAPVMTPVAGTAPITTAPAPPNATEGVASAPTSPVVSQPAPSLPAAPTAPTAPTAPHNYSGAQSGGYQPPEDVPTTYAQFIVMLTGKMQAKLITGEEISAVCQLNGLPSLTQLANAPHLVGAVYEGCKAVWSVK